MKEVYFNRDFSGKWLAEFADEISMEENHQNSTPFELHIEIEIPTNYLESKIGAKNYLKSVVSDSQSNLWNKK